MNSFFAECIQSGTQMHTHIFRKTDIFFSLELYGALNTFYDVKKPEKSKSGIKMN